jgi:type II secretory pathway pseudopilin PulG
LNLGKTIRLRRAARAARSRGEESGYTLLLVVFFAAVMIIAASVVLPNLITEDRRQKEQLMIWRGRQYERAIGLYYHKTGHYPHDLKELAKGVAGIHFLRKSYKDPMNTQDGSWRLIYLGKGGQFIGSLRWKTMAQYQAAQLGLPAPGTKSGKKKKKDKFGFAGNSLGGGADDQSDSFSQPHTRIINEGDMMGGNLIGVASKVNAKSLKAFMGAKNYRDWEFIWNPLEGKRLGLGAAPASKKGKKSPKSDKSNTPTSPTPEPPKPKPPEQP